MRTFRITFAAAVSELDSEFVIDRANGERVRAFRATLIWMSKRTRTITERVH